MSTLPQGSLPADYKSTIASLIREVGLSVMTPKLLNRRLEAKYNIDFVPHKSAVESYVEEFMRTPDIQRELAVIKQDSQEGPAGGKGKKRGRIGVDNRDKKDKKEKEKHDKKPADYPKGACSPYIFFGNDQREKIRATNPDIKMSDILREIGLKWKSISSEEKDHYNKLANADKLRYENEMRAWTAKGGAVFKRGHKGSKGSGAKKVKDPNAPKRGLSAFFFFASDFRAANKELPAKEQMTKAGAAWKAMTPEQKKPYEDSAEADKQRYHRELQERGINTSHSSRPKGDDKDAASSSSDDDSSSSSSSDDDE